MLGSQRISLLEKRSFEPSWPSSSFCRSGHSRPQLKKNVTVNITNEHIKNNCINVSEFFVEFGS